MEQELMDFDEWIKLPVNQTIEYYAIFKDDGALIGVYPSHAVMDLTNKIKIDDEIAVAISTGVENLFSYRVDVPTKKLVKLNKFSTHSLIKIDDILHRVIDKKWSSIQDPDIVISHNAKNNTLTFSMSDKYSNNIIWDGATEMIFLVTDYNDPNVLIHMLSIRAGDITENTKSFTLDLPTRFSVYTRRIFDKYLFETT
jgi:hypothetical protein